LHITVPGRNSRSMSQPDQCSEQFWMTVAFDSSRTYGAWASQMAIGVVLAASDLGSF